MGDLAPRRGIGDLAPASVAAVASAITGSMRVTRRAGRKLATRLASASVIGDRDEHGRVARIDVVEDRLQRAGCGQRQHQPEEQAERRAG